MQVQNSALRVRDRGPSQEDRRPRAHLSLVSSLDNWFVKGTSDAAYEWIKKNLPAAKDDEETDHRVRLLDNYGKPHKVFPVDSSFLSDLAAAQAHNGRITFKTYRKNARDQLVKTAYKRAVKESAESLPPKKRLRH
ncbi:MAG: hypothetical protein AAB615_03425 [Patescibacteria group bacterium]